MFVAHDVLMDVAFRAARPRLANLVGDHVLVDASQAAYKEGLASIALASPGDDRAAATLVRVRFLKPAERADTMTVGLRWEASGVTGGLFPVLDADLTLLATSPQTTTLTLAGVYRPPFGHLNDGLDADTLDRLADVTVQALLRRTADYLTRPGVGWPAAPPPAAEQITQP